MKVKVAEGLQVAHEGTVWRDGATADVPDHVAEPWLEAGWVTEVTAAKPRGRKA
jgi:hypothetical protein